MPTAKLPCPGRHMWLANWEAWRRRVRELPRERGTDLKCSEFSIRNFSMRALSARFNIALRCEVYSSPVNGSEGRRPHLASSSECLSMVD